MVGDAGGIELQSHQNTRIPRSRKLILTKTLFNYNRPSQRPSSDPGPLLGAEYRESVSRFAASVRLLRSTASRFAAFAGRVVVVQPLTTTAVHSAAPLRNLNNALIAASLPTAQTGTHKYPRSAQSAHSTMHPHHAPTPRSSATT